MPNRNSIEIDDTHSNAICNEVGNRLRVALSQEPQDCPGPCKGSQSSSEDRTKLKQPPSLQRNHVGKIRFASRLALHDAPYSPATIRPSRLQRVRSVPLLTLRRTSSVID